MWTTTNFVITRPKDRKFAVDSSSVGRRAINEHLMSIFRNLNGMGNFAYVRYFFTSVKKGSMSKITHSLCLNLISLSKLEINVRFPSIWWLIRRYCSKCMCWRSRSSMITTRACTIPLPYLWTILILMRASMCLAKPVWKRDRVVSFPNQQHINRVNSKAKAWGRRRRWWARRQIVKNLKKRVWASVTTYQPRNRVSV